MKIASIADIKARLSSYVQATSQGPIVVTRNGKAVAVLLGVQDDDQLERLLLANSTKLRALLDAADRRLDHGEGIPHKEFWKQVESGHSTGRQSRRKPRRSRA
jgi:prevent-host-death family protein